LGVGGGAGGGAVEGVEGLPGLTGILVDLGNGDIGGEVGGVEIQGLQGVLEANVGFGEVLCVELGEIEVREGRLGGGLDRVLEDLDAAGGIAAAGELVGDLDGKLRVAGVERERLLVIGEGRVGVGIVLRDDGLGEGGEGVGFVGGGLGECEIGGGGRVGTGQDIRLGGCGVTGIVGDSERAVVAGENESSDACHRKARGREAPRLAL